MNFDKKKSIVLEIRDNEIEIIVGNLKKIEIEDTIKIKKGLCEDGYIINTMEVSNILQKYFLENDVDEKFISFVVYGSDTIVRNIELPYIKGKELRKNIQFEVDEIINNKEQYYIDYEIIKVNKDDEGKKSSCEILIVACPKQKIDLLVELSEILGKEVGIIDTLANTLNKILVNGVMDYTGKDVGLVYLGNDFSNISISKDVILKMERTIPFGAYNIARELKNIIEVKEEKKLTIEEAYNRFEKESMDIEMLFLKYPRVKEVIDQFLQLVYKTIKFYNSDRKNKDVVEIVLISKFNISNSFKEYLEEYFNLPTYYIEGHKELGIKIKSKNDEVFKYLALYGLLLRR